MRKRKPVAVDAGRLRAVLGARAVVIVAFDADEGRACTVSAGCTIGDRDQLDGWIRSVRPLAKGSDTFFHGQRRDTPPPPPLVPPRPPRMVFRIPGLPDHELKAAADPELTLEESERLRGSGPDGSDGQDE